MVTLTNVVMVALSASHSADLDVLTLMQRIIVVPLMVLLIANSIVGAFILLLLCVIFGILYLGEDGVLNFLILMVQVHTCPHIATVALLGLMRDIVYSVVPPVVPVMEVKH